MKKTMTLMILALLFCTPLSFAQEKIEVRIKDGTRIKGFEREFLVGFGIVTGLAGTGDSDEALTQQTLSNVLKHLDIDIDEEDLKMNNCAAVMITAHFDGPGYKGDLLDCSITTVGDASSLVGGTLQMSPILNPKGEMAAIAQGDLTTGGFSFGSEGEGGNTVTKNHPTAGRLTDGAKLTHDQNLAQLKRESFELILKRADFSSASRIEDAINKKFFGMAKVDGKGQVIVKVPSEYRELNKVPHFISEVQSLKYQPDQVARIVINEKTGTIVVGSNVKISPVAIAHGNLFVSVKRTQEVSQPNPESWRGETVVVDNEETTVEEEKVRFQKIPAITTVDDMVNALNKLGVSPRDMMSIFQTLKRQGALHAKLEVQ